LAIFYHYDRHNRRGPLKVDCACSAINGQKVREMPEAKGVSSYALVKKNSSLAVHLAMIGTG
jgi:hypothetical protein